MKYAIMVLALVGVLARPTAAIAEATGNKMLELCTQSADVGVALCAAGYAWGWRSGHTVAILVAR